MDVPGSSISKSAALKKTWLAFFKLNYLNSSPIGKICPIQIRFL
jgi:hypothetical protein